MALERRNTIAAVPSLATAPPAKPRHHHSSSFTASSSSYTSIKEVIAASSTPTGSIASSAGEIPIRNHLVKQAAWAYLRPMSTSPDSSSGNLISRFATAVRNFPLFSAIRSAAHAVVANVFGCFGF